MKNISIYVPTLNSQDTIKECLQGLPTGDVTVIDGGSQDSTLKIVKSLKVKIHKERSKNLANARNLAIEDCKTEFIAFLDSDVILGKDWFNIIMKNFKKNVVGVCGKLKERFTESLPDKWRAFHLKQKWGNKRIKNPDFIFGSNAIFKTKYLTKVGGFDEKYKTNYEDVDISKRLKGRGYDLIYEPKALCYHLKKDTIFSVLQMARNWSFYSYELPDTFFRLLKRLFVFNPIIFFSYIIKDIIKFKLSFVLITASSFLYNQFYDIYYFLRNP